MMSPAVLADIEQGSLRARTAWLMLALGYAGFLVSFFLPVIGEEMVGWAAAFLGFLMSMGVILGGEVTGLTGLVFWLILFGSALCNTFVLAAPWTAMRVRRGDPAWASRARVVASACLAFSVKWSFVGLGSGQENASSSDLEVGYHLWWASQAVVAAALYLLPLGEPSPLRLASFLREDQEI